MARMTRMARILGRPALSLDRGFIMICFGSLERDYSLSTGDMTLKKGLRLQHAKDVQLHNLLGSPRPVNELRITCDCL